MVKAVQDLIGGNTDICTTLQKEDLVKTAEKRLTVEVHQQEKDSKNSNLV